MTTSKPITVFDWRQVGELKKVEISYSYEELLETFPPDNGNVVHPLVKRCMEYEAEIKRLRELLERWLRVMARTHNIFGEPLGFVQDTYIALGREPLKPMVRE